MNKIENAAYELELLREVAFTHPMFHISMLKKYINDPSYIIPIENDEVKDNYHIKRFQFRFYIVRFISLGLKRLHQSKSY